MSTPTELTVPVGLAGAAPDRQRARRARTRRALVQSGIVAAVAIALLAFGYAVRDGLARHGVTFSFAYLGSSAGFEISEGRTLSLADGWPALSTFASADDNAQALVTGLVNTIKVALTAIVLSTVLGTVLGVGRLSTNWIVRQGCFAAVEFVRNTPLLIQLVFWYFAVVLQFPPAAHAAKLLGGVVASQQGVSIPAIVPSEAASTASVATLVLGLVLLAGGLRFRRSGRARWILPAAGAACVAGSALLGFPLALEVPEAGRFSITGGTNMSPEMSAILLAIVVNSGSYIAEIVRGTIESMPKGQWEAAAALGMNRRLMLSEIILPQVFRVVLPSFGNQYISLAKNTSLGIAIGYPDLFNVNGTVSNQTGRSLEGIIIVMVTYLVLSWAISGAVNIANVRLRKGLAR